MSVAKLINNLDQDIFKVLLKHAKPSSSFQGVEIPEITTWKFCDVMDLMGNSTPVNMIKVATGLPEKAILKGDQKAFIRALKHLTIEVKKIEKLEEQLRVEPDADMINAGIDKLNVFGVVALYYAINPDPRFWDEISVVPYHKMWSKLMLDKTNKQIQKEYDQLVLEKQKNNMKR